MWLYRFCFSIYIFLFRIISIRHKKAKKMVKGHKSTWNIIKNIDHKKKWLWFHASSLGEFEQGKPVIEKIKKEHPEFKILLSFYSPSGYEVKKDYKGADIICYLPFDTKHNVKKFLNYCNPDIAFFIKYEFWPNYLTELKKRKIPTYLISGIFRPDQLFFKPYAGFYRNLLKNFTHFFIQNEESKELLASIGIKNVTISGDTRFDRVIEIAEQSKELPVIEKFKNEDNRKIIIAGSSWPKDEEQFIPFFNNNKDLKLILVPHEIHEKHLKSIEALLERPSIRYSKSTTENISNYDCIIIDCFGLLSSIYKYGDAAYIGGGFGVGIHNTLEAAVYGIPIFFGPNYHKFEEAKNLIKSGGGFCVNNEEEIDDYFKKILTNTKFTAEAGKKAENLVKENNGGTNLIFQKISL